MDLHVEWFIKHEDGGGNQKITANPSHRVMNTKMWVRERTRWMKRQEEKGEKERSKLATHWLIAVEERVHWRSWLNVRDVAVVNRGRERETRIKGEEKMGNTPTNFTGGTIYRRSVPCKYEPSQPSQSNYRGTHVGTKLFLPILFFWPNLVFFSLRFIFVFYFIFD